MLGWIIANPWWALAIVVVLIVGINFGVKKGWERLTLMYNVKGEPLAPLGFTLKRASSVMFTEDTTPVFQKYPKFTWRMFWRTEVSLVSMMLVVAVLFPNTITLSALGVLTFVGLLGLNHLRTIFKYRHQVLKQMFEVAQMEMRYQRGAELNPWGYVDISGWTRLYDPQTTTVLFPAKYRSDDPRNRAAFETHFNGTVSGHHTWEYSWEPSANRVVCTPVPFIQEAYDYPFPDKHPWNEFPLGMASGGVEAVWNVSVFPHCLVAGTTGSGKSVTQGTILLHALQSPEWRVVLVDPKRVELTVYRDHPNVLRVATELEDSLALIEQIEQEMQSRYIRMGQAGVKHFKSLETPPPAVLLMVDETFQLLSPTGIKSEEGKAQDEMKARIGILLSDIARLGRASGIHMILATQRPDAKVLPGELKANLDARIAQGRMDTTPSLMTLDSDAATKIPPIKGRAVLRTGSETTEFQAYFLPEQQLPMVLKMAAAIAEGDTSFLDPVAPAGEASEGSAGLSSKLPSVKMPAIKLPAGLQGGLSAWVEKRKAIVEENERRAGRAVEQHKERRARGGGKVQPEQAAEQPRPEPPSVEEVAAELQSRGVTATGMTLFDKNYGSESDLFAAPGPDSGAHYDEDEPDVDDELAEIWGAVAPPAAQSPAGHSPVQAAPPVEPVLIQPVVPVAAAPVHQPVTETEPEPPVMAPAQEVPGVHGQGLPVQNPPAQSLPGIQPVAAPAPPASTISVQEVMRRAAERGIPIPASELLAALRAEAARAQQPAARPQMSAESPLFEPAAPSPEPVPAPAAPAPLPAPPAPQSAPAAPPTIPPPPAAPAPLSPSPVLPEPAVEAEEESSQVPSGPRRPQRPGLPPQQVQAPAGVPAPQEAPATAPAPAEDVVEAPWMPKTIPSQQTGRPSPFGLPPAPPQRER